MKNSINTGRSNPLAKFLQMTLAAILLNTLVANTKLEAQNTADIVVQPSLDTEPKNTSVIDTQISKEDSLQHVYLKRIQEYFTNKFAVEIRKQTFFSKEKSEQLFDKQFEVLIKDIKTAKDIVQLETAVNALDQYIISQLENNNKVNQSEVNVIRKSLDQPYALIYQAQSGQEVTETDQITFNKVQEEEKIGVMKDRVIESIETMNRGFTDKKNIAAYTIYQTMYINKIKADPSASNLLKVIGDIKRDVYRL